MSHTPGTGEMRAAMRDAVQRSKGNSKQARNSKTKWKEATQKKRKVRSLLALAVLVPLSAVCLLYPLHSFGILRLGTPAPLSKALAHPSTADQLDLSRQFLTEIPTEIENLKNLKVLILDSNELKSLNTPIFSLGKLEVLSANGNDLDDLPSELGKLASLKQLHLSGNRLSSLPEEVLKLGNLEVLNIKGNALTKLPKDIGKLKKLKTLDLKGNSISSLPDGLSKLENLEILSLSGNKLNEIPDLSGLKRLKSVVVRDTGLSSVEIDTLKQRVGTKVTVISG